MSKPTYITTPIYYVNDRPHLGHAYTSTICDVYARFMRFAGRRVFFLTGTDEHGRKVEHSARDRGISPQQLADENAAEFQRVFATLGLTNDDFIRTTQPRHVRQVSSFVKRLLETKAMYLGEFEGWYDEGQEEYYPESKARDLDYTSPVNRKPLVRAKEKNYYFRLSAYQKKLEALYADHPGFVRPEARRNEMLAVLREGLQDVPMSRTNFTWGIPMPDNPQHVIYVWIDALMNYITALGLGEPDGKLAADRAAFWPADYHVIGKEILRFHALIWPAMLMALDFPVPRCVYAHSFWTSEGQKMSKSLGNFIDLETIQGYVDTYGLDALRYYLATHGPIGAADADFRARHLHEIYTTDLVNTLGNCVSRVTAMINRYFDGLIPTEQPGGVRIAIEGPDWPAVCRETVERSSAAMEQFDLHGSIGAGLGLVRQVDGFINSTEPYKLAKDESQRDRLGAILYQCLEVLRIASLLLWGVMPSRMAALWSELGLSVDPEAGTLDELAAWGGLSPGGRVAKIALFPRLDLPEAAEGALAPPPAAGG